MITNTPFLFYFYRNNNFFFAGEGNSQLKCPFAAHVRKTNPRDDLEAAPNGASIPVEGNRIMRRGVQFGPELTAQEKATGVTAHGRGLLFACYQTNLFNGFQFLQHSEYPGTSTLWRRSDLQLIERLGK